MRTFLSKVFHKLGRMAAPAGTIPNLSGDRDIEWMYIVLRMGRLASKGKRILDFGSGGGLLSHAAGLSGADTLAVDLIPLKLAAEFDTLEFRQMDIMDMGDEKFDVIVNCSVIEHVGLGARYDMNSDNERDMKAMQKLRSMLNPGGKMLITLPVGKDDVFAPYHRVYGQQRLPKLLEGFSVDEEEFWKKNGKNLWVKCSRDDACNVQGSNSYYALGCLTLGLPDKA